MTPVTLPAPSTEAAPRRYSFSIDEYLQLFEKGILAPDLRTELIDGEIIQMRPPGPEHILLTVRLRDFFLKRLPDQYCVLTESPIQFEDDLLHPDVAIVRGPLEKLTKGYFSPSDVVSLFEVSKTTLNYDLEQKSRLYARCGVSQYFVVDLTQSRLIVFQNPQKAKYSLQTTLASDQTAELTLDDGEKIAFTFDQFFGK